MKSPKIPDNEASRMRDLLELNLLDTPANLDLDLITEMVSNICETPISLISIVDSDRQWFKSKVGLDASETPRDLAFCAHAINEPDQLFLIPDATKDERFHDNPLVTGDPNVIFYCGFPILSENGHAIGTLCAIDNKPRELNDHQKESIKSLSKIAAKLILADKKNVLLEEHLEKLNKVLDHSSGLFIRISDEGAVLNAGGIWEKVLGEEFLYKNIDEIFEFSDFKRFKDLAENYEPGSIIFFSDKKSKLKFKASFLSLNKTYVLLTHPIINAESPLKGFNLNLNDFPEHDYVAEYIFMSEISVKGMQDAQELNIKLNKKNSELKSSLEKVEQISSFPNQNPHPVIRVNSDLKILYANKSGLHLIDGYVVEDDFSGFIPLINQVKQQFKNHHEPVLEEIIEMNARTFVFTLVYFEEFDFVNIYGFEITNYSEEINHQKEELLQLNKKLKLQEGFLQSILDLLPVDVCLFDQDGRFRFINKTAVKDDELRAWMIGKTESDYLEKKGLPSDRFDQRKAHFNRMLETGEPIEWIEETFDSSKNRYFLRSFSPPTSMIDKDTYIIAYGLDITDTIESKAALEELNLNLEKTVELKTNENLELNANLNEIEKFVAIGELTMGIAHDLNSPLAAILIGAKNVRETLEILFHGLIHDCSPEELEFACVHAMSGDLKSFQSSLKAMKERNQLQQLLQDEKGFSQEESLEIADGLLKARVGIDETEKINRVIESANQKKFLELMRHIYTIRQMVDTILDAANRSADVISDLRKFTKSAVHQREETINIADSVNSVLRVLSTNLKGNIDVHIDVPNSHEIFGVPRDVFQIWSNVIKNALEALGEQGGDLWIRSVKEGDTIKLEFENNGPDIPKEFLSKIFERFKSSKGGDNHGFGLNIVKRIADANGWDVNVVSENNSTVFMFTIKTTNIF